MPDPDPIDSPVFTRDDLDQILTALQAAKQAFGNYANYPSEEFRRAQLDRVESVIAKVRIMRKGAKQNV